MVSTNYLHYEGVVELLVPLSPVSLYNESTCLFQAAGLGKEIHDGSEEYSRVDGSDGKHR